MRFLGAAAEGRYEPMRSEVYTQYEYPYGSSSGAFREFAERKGDVRGLQQMVRVGDWVALRTRIREGGAKVRLYNVAEDPFQSCDRSGDTDQQSRLAELTAILDKRLHE